MSKRLLAAGILRDFEFDSMDSLYLYLYALQHRCISFRCVKTFVRADGTVLARILCQYNSSDLIEL